MALWPAVVAELVDEAQHDVVEAGAQAAARDDGDVHLRRVEVDRLPGTGAHRPGRQGHAHLPGEGTYCIRWVEGSPSRSHHDGSRDGRRSEGVQMEWLT